MVPHATEHISPLPSPPVQSLELSDNDSNLGTAQATPKVNFTSVPVNDGSVQKKVKKKAYVN